jgi:hypothetical protein
VTIRKVQITPIFPRPAGADVWALAQFNTDLIKQLFRSMGEQATAINLLIDKVRELEARIEDLEP